MTTGPGPTVRRRQLGKELRRLREGAGKTITEAAQWVGIKPPTVSKIENGRQAIRPTNVRLLLQLYGIGAPDADTLIRLAGEANQRGWWASYGDTVPDWFRNFVGLEADASEINGYDSELVPGQLPLCRGRHAGGRRPRDPRQQGPCWASAHLHPCSPAQWAAFIADVRNGEPD